MTAQGMKQRTQCSSCCSLPAAVDEPTAFASVAVLLSTAEVLQLLHTSSVIYEILAFHLECLNYCLVHAWYQLCV
jgi:hypothetical protein